MNKKIISSISGFTERNADKEIAEDVRLLAGRMQKKGETDNGQIK